MKKIIVMLLFIAAFVGGAFANEITTGTGQAKKSATSDTTITLSASDNATMVMHYTPYSGVAYYVIGFDANATPMVSVDSSTGHLKFDGDFSGSERMDLTRTVASQKVYGTGKFNIYYEVLTTTPVNIKVKFEKNFKDQATGEDVDGFTFTEKFTTESVTSVGEKEYKITSINPASGTSGLFAGIVPVSIETTDVSKFPAKEYASTVTLTIYSGV